MGTDDAPRRGFDRKETPNAAPAPAAKPPAKEDVGCGVAIAAIAPAATSPSSSTRDTGTGGIIGVRPPRTTLPLIFIKLKDLGKP